MSANDEMKAILAEKGAEMALDPAKALQVLDMARLALGGGNPKDMFTVERTAQFLGVSESAIESVYRKRRAGRAVQLGLIASMGRIVEFAAKAVGSDGPRRGRPPRPRAFLPTA